MIGEFITSFLKEIFFSQILEFLYERKEIKDFCKEAKNQELLEQFVNRAKKGKIKVFSSTKKAINYLAPNSMKLPQNFTSYENEFLEKSEWFKKSVDGFVLCEKLKRHKRLIKQCVEQNDKDLNEMTKRMCSNAIDSSEKLQIILR